jgi:hypothetical protein
MGRRQDQRPATPGDPFLGHRTVGLVAWILLRNALWFVGFMSLYAIWITPLAGWAAETPVEPETDNAATDRGSPGSAEVDTPDSLAQAEPI